jgi:quercetin dioxygenase-like cupin family protein
MAPGSTTITERIIRARSCDPVLGAEGVELRTFVSESCGATRFSTGTATFRPGAYLPYHAHRFSEAVTILRGQGRVVIEGRTYKLASRDCVHIPAGVAHSVRNEDSSTELVAHWAFASAQPTREPVDRAFTIEDCGAGNPGPDDPETIVRFENCPVYELSERAFFNDLFAHRLGAAGICGGYGRFLNGASLPCHIHDYDESITIVKGVAACLVQGRRYEMSDGDTAFVPKGFPHRFLNASHEEMAMVWVYAGDEPDRRIVDNGYCAGVLSWPGPEIASRDQEGRDE